MQARPVVYVNRITNLSDARYCAGMGADLLGFIVDPDHPDYVSPESYREMIGWISGPKRVAETLVPAGCDPDAVAARYQPDYIHLPFSAIQQFVRLKIPLIAEVPFEKYETFMAEIDPSLPLSFVVVIGMPDTIQSALRASPPTLVGTEAPVGSSLDFLKRTGAQGFVLQGSRELSPGLKDYDSLSRLLEELDSLQS